MNSDQEKMKQQLAYLNTITAGNPGPAIEHLKNINRIMSSDNKNKVSEIANTSFDFLKSKPNDEGKENITKMCEMNITVMPYIVEHYNKPTDKNQENRVTVYNKMNEEQSFWYNFFYGIIFGIEKNLNEKALAEGSSEIKLDRNSMRKIQSNLAGLCKNVQLKKDGKLMTGGMNVQLFGVLIFGFASLVTAYLPSEVKFVPNKYEGMELSTGENVINVAAKAIPIGSGIGAIGLGVAGMPDEAAKLVEYGFKAEAAVVGMDFVNQYIGLTAEEKREKFGQIANMAVADLRKFADTGKDMVSPMELLTESLNNQLLKKTIMVQSTDGTKKPIGPESTQGKAIQNAFRFINGQDEIKVFFEEYSKYAAEWKRYSSQSSNPARDTKGIFRGNLVSYKDVSSIGVAFTDKLEANYKKVVQQAGLDINDIQHLSNIMNEFGDLYFNNEMTISEDTLNLMIKLDNALQDGKDGGILDAFKHNNLADQNKEDWKEFKDKIDNLELNVYMSWMVWFMRHATKFGLGTVLIYAYMNSGKNTTWFQWFKSWVSSSEKEGSSATGGKRKTRSKKIKKRKTKKNHKRRNKKRVK
jgi:hypothetical protein